MSYGAVFTNDSGISNIDADQLSYVYLGKYGPFGGDYLVEYDVDVTCVGYPLVFFSVPYNFTAGDGYSGLAWLRSGVAIGKITSLGSNTWRVHIIGDNASLRDSYVSLNTELRVFGRLDLNYPSGSSINYGVRMWDSAGRISFDSGLRQLRLAGNTYDQEITLGDYIGTQGEGLTNSNYTAQDKSLTVPFNMAGKSICANTRGVIEVYTQTGVYYDPGIATSVYTYDAWDLAPCYWASGTTLYARQMPIRQRSFDSFGGSYNGPAPEGFGAVYTRLAVIDNSKFP